MLRLVLNWFSIFRQLDEKTQAWAEVENWLPWTRGQPASKEVGESKQFFSSLLWFQWGGRGTQGVCEVDYVILGTSRHIPGGIGEWQQLADFCLGERGR